MWAWRFSTLVALLVGLLSWWNGVEPFSLIFRIALAFAVIFGLTSGSFYLFTKFAPLSAEETPADGGDGRGGLLDVTVGDDPENSPESNEGKGMEAQAMPKDWRPGQLSPSLMGGLPDDKKQAEIVRRMGWGD